MTDRELLELAAKAAGINTKRSLQYADGAYDWPEKSGRWNPLSDDGDALRLAVKLKLLLDYANSYYFTDGPLTKCGDFWNERESCYQPFVEAHNTDPYAATRRAIVRAAAEIGASL